MLTNSLDQLRKMVKVYSTRKQEPIAFDIETTGKNPYKSKIVMLQFMQPNRKPVLFDFREYNTEQGRREVAEVISPLFTDTFTILGTNLKFDYSFLVAQLHIPIKAITTHDCMIAEQVIYGLGYSTAKLNGVGLRLDAMAARYGEEASKEMRDWFYAPAPLDERPEWGEAFPPKILSYAERDVSVLFPIYNKQREALAKKRLEGIMDLEGRVVLAVVAMETNGVYIDKQGWMEAINHVVQQSRIIEDELHEELDPHIYAARSEQYERTSAPWKEWRKQYEEFEASLKPFWEQLPEPREKWGDFKRLAIRGWKEQVPEPRKVKLDTTPPNLGSSTQLKMGLLHMGIEVQNTAKEALEELADAHPFIAKLLEYKAAAKLADAFGQSLIDKIDPELNRLRASYQQIGADTGRMSSHHPNTQQIPSKGVGAVLRHHIQPEAGNKFVICDFPNIELRILASLSRDETMIRMFNENLDLHSKTAVMMFGLPDDESYDKTAREEAVMNGRALGTSWRNIAKTINFGLLYGMGPSKLGRTLKISANDAKLIMNKYFQLYAGVKSWLDQQKKRVDKAMEAQKKRMYSSTIAGRKRFYTIPVQPSLPLRPTRAQVEAHTVAMDDYKGDIAYIKRQCGNSPIQGTSADITKEALAKMQDVLGWRQEAKMVFVVHDEIGLEVPEEQAQAWAAILGSVMREAAQNALKYVSVPELEPVIAEYWQH